MLRESNIAGFKFYSLSQWLSGGANEQRQDTAGVLSVKIELSLPKKLKSHINEPEVQNVQRACACMYTHTFICTHEHAHTFICTHEHTHTYIGICNINSHL